VAEGETLFQVAQLEGIRLNNLLEYNSLKNDVQPVAGQKLYLQEPANRESEEKKTGHNLNAVEEKNDPVETVLHTVQPKETMYAIAKKYAVTVEELMAWNQMQSNDLRTGQQLRINKKTADATN
jgi:membrane-bound lytic murein transglycosylase D